MLYYKSKYIGLRYIWSQIFLIQKNVSFFLLSTFSAKTYFLKCTFPFILWDINKISNVLRTNFQNVRLRLNILKQYRYILGFFCISESLKIKSLNFEKWKIVVKIVWNFCILSLIQFNIFSAVEGKKITIKVHFM